MPRCLLLSPSTDILNQVAVKIPKADEHLERAWLVAKYIFPRQYGLHNVFTFEKEKGAWGFRDYSSRDKELSVRLSKFNCL